MYIISDFGALHISAYSFIDLLQNREIKEEKAIRKCGSRAFGELIFHRPTFAQQQPPDLFPTLFVFPMSTFPLGPDGDGPEPGPILFLISDAIVKKA